MTLRANSILIADPPSSKNQPNAAQSFTKRSSLNTGSLTPISLILHKQYCHRNIYLKESPHKCIIQPGQYAQAFIYNKITSLKDF